MKKVSFLIYIYIVLIFSAGRPLMGEENRKLFSGGKENAEMQI